MSGGTPRKNLDESITSPARRGSVRALAGKHAQKAEESTIARTSSSKVEGRRGSVRELADHHESEAERAKMPVFFERQIETYHTQNELEVLKRKYEDSGMESFDEFYEKYTETLLQDGGTANADDAHTAAERAAEAVSSRLAAESGAAHEPYSSQTRKAEGHIQDDDMAGIGVLLELCGDEIFIKAVAAGGPAAKEKRIRPGQRLLSIDNQDVSTMDFASVIDGIVGPLGSVLALRLQDVDDPAAEAVGVSVVRDLIQTPENISRLGIGKGRPVEFTGVGVLLEQVGSAYVVRKIAEGGPAAQHPHLREGQRILSVDDVEVDQLQFAEVLALVRGPVGSSVSMKVVNEKAGPEDVLTVSLRRDYVKCRTAATEE